MSDDVTKILLARTIEYCLIMGEVARAEWELNKSREDHDKWQGYRKDVKILQSELDGLNGFGRRGLKL